MGDDNGRSYVDVRIWLDREVEDDGDGGQFVDYSATAVERTGSTLTQVELEGLAECAAQSDRWQIAVHSAVDQALYADGEVDATGW